MSTAPLALDEDTPRVIAEKAKLKPSLRRFDMTFFTICAIVTLDTLGQVSGFGAATFTWILILCVLFLLPYGLITAELGTTFPQEGGPYEWMKRAFGRPFAAIGSFFNWVSNPLWIGGSLAFLATEAVSTEIVGIPEGSVWDYGAKLTFIWVCAIITIVSLKHGKWIPITGAFVRIAVLGLFSVTVAIYGMQNGLSGYGPGDFSPWSLTVLLGLVPLLLFNFVGFEAQSAASEEMVNPARDVPASILRSGIVSSMLYGIPILGILAVLPKDNITGIGGFLDAVDTVFSIYGPLQTPLLWLMTGMFVYALLSAGAVWMMSGDRTQAIAAADNGFFPSLGEFSARLGTPVRMNVLSAVISSVFMIAAMQLGGSNTFAIVLGLATSTALMSYLFIFPTVIRLRRRYPGVARPYRVPGGTVGLWVATSLATGWIALGTWVAIFPGTIETLFGIEYSMVDAYGVSRATFQAFTLGTLGALVLLAVAGYLWPRRSDIFLLQPGVTLDRMNEAVRS
jgi:glutamate:GABA antiporter